MWVSISKKRLAAVSHCGLCQKNFDLFVTNTYQLGGRGFLSWACVEHNRYCKERRWECTAVSTNNYLPGFCLCLTWHTFLHMLLIASQNCTTCSCYCVLMSVKSCGPWCTDSVLPTLHDHNVNLLFDLQSAREVEEQWDGLTGKCLCCQQPLKALGRLLHWSVLR